MKYIEPIVAIKNVQNNEQSSFGYLKLANKYLSSPIDASIGREYIIRALANIDFFEENSFLLKNLVRKAGLYPYLKKYFDIKDTDDLNLLISLYQSEANEEFVFHSMQAKIFRLLMSGKNVVLSAPTSMGKSAIVDSLIASDKFRRIVVVVPTIALIDETRRRILKNFGTKYQIVHHGTQLCHKKRVIYVLTQERVNERSDIENIDLFILDEFYKLAFNQEEKSRAVALNIALSKLLLCSKQFYMIGPYIDAVRGIENIERDYAFIPSEFNTVALNIKEYNLRPNDEEGKNKILHDVIKDYSGQTIIYCKSQKSISQVINYMVRLLPSSSEEFKAYRDWLEANYGFDWCYSKALRHGIGIHHGVLPRALQQKTVELFNCGLIKYLVCTSTLIEGVNTVAENVVIYDNKRANTPIDTFTHKNIAGRAGRMNKHLIGNVFCLESLPERKELSNVVDIPLGQQSENTPLNLLASIQEEHLSTVGSESLKKFGTSSSIPVDLLRKHASYGVEDITEAYSYVRDLSLENKRLLIETRNPDGRQLKLLSSFIKTVEFSSLRKMNLHYEDNHDIHNRMAWYIYANSHTDYIQDRLNNIYEYFDEPQQRSEATDKELKIIRNIFKYAIPRSLVLLQDLLNEPSITIAQQGDADFGMLIHIFENSHLPSSFSALEEMGIAIETLEKLVNPRLAQANIDTLVRYFRWHIKYANNLTDVDRTFIKMALN